jgi:protein-tyrosine-phosphatase
MAEAILRARAQRELPCSVTSAGIAARDGLPASAEGIAALREWGLDLSTHRSRPLTRDLVDGADLLVPLALPHFHVILERFPDARAKILLLGSFLDPRLREPHDIPDPIGGSLRDYRATRDLIARAVEALARFLAQDEPLV